MKIVLAGGGTAGHVEPALAVARELISRYPSCTLTFIGTNDGLEKTLVPQAGFQLSCITKAPFPRRLSLSAFKWPFRYFNTVWQSFRLVRGADAVIGFGGYVSAPVYMAAYLRRIPLFVHEANAKPGLANLLGARIARACMVAYASTRFNYESMRKAHIVGIPLRASIINLAHATKEVKAERRSHVLKEWGFQNRETILVVGGSSGSASMNAVIVKALDQFLKKGLQVVHVVGSKNELPLSQPGYLPLRYISNMADALVACDWVIARSGAVTCVELAVMDKFALLVPLSIGNGEQFFNAEPLVANGQAITVANQEFTDEWLIENLEHVQKMAQKGHFKHLDFPTNSAELIVNIVFENLQQRSPSEGV